MGNKAEITLCDGSKIMRAVTHIYANGNLWQGQIRYNNEIRFVTAPRKHTWKAPAKGWKM